ncbi:hypothetical protein ACFV3R_03120 [Streptomyces sp. NPDC059740]|uniref:SCO2583 family membrane protein n=1 Tax=Streptomyces sp. NPDC059740 TaxID=3346926 RepID=UPI003649415C
MGGTANPPEGPEGPSGGSEDEYRSVVFDESFVRAARLQELSARERLVEHTQAVRPRHLWTRLGGSRQALLLVMLIVVAFGTAIYMGIRHPYRTPEHLPPQVMRSEVIPLAPRGEVPAGRPGELVRRSPAASYGIGAAGIDPPDPARTLHFSAAEIGSAQAIAKDYLVRSSLDPETLAGGPARAVRALLSTDQLDQFDRSMERPTADGRHAATGWVVRIDPDVARLAGPGVRVHGTMRTRESGASALEVTADYTFVYVLRPADDGKGTGEAAGGATVTPAAYRTAARTPAASPSDEGADGPPADTENAASLFTVHREVHFRIGREDLADHRLQVQQSLLEAGPLSCSADPADLLSPLLAGQKATGDQPPGTDPFRHGSRPTPLCGTLADGAQPSPAQSTTPAPDGPSVSRH